MHTEWAGLSNPLIPRRFAPPADASDAAGKRNIQDGSASCVDRRDNCRDEESPPWPSRLCVDHSCSFNSFKKLISICLAPDSDDSGIRATNRGQKLKRKAKFVHEGHLSGKKVYKRVRYCSGSHAAWRAYCGTLLRFPKKIEHAGYHRYIINQNPKRYDEYGDELEDDEEDGRADAEATEENPYNEVRLEGMACLHG